MRIITIQARCPARRSELAGLTDREAACAIENAVSMILLQLCGEIIMELVEVTSEPDGWDNARLRPADEDLRTGHSA